MEEIISCKTFNTKHGEVDYFEEGNKIFFRGTHICKILDIPSPSVNIRYYCKDVVKRTVSAGKGKMEVLFIDIEGLDALISRSKESCKEDFRNELKEFVEEKTIMKKSNPFEFVDEIVNMVEAKYQKMDFESKEDNCMSDYSDKNKDCQITKLDVFFKAEMKEYVVDSRQVAEMTGKEHKNLLRDIAGYIETMTKSDKISQLKIEPSDFFIESTFENRGKQYPCYLLTKKGCDMVANKMTGEKGVLFTAAYVTAFEEMREHIEKGAQQSSDIRIDIENVDPELLRKLANAIDDRKACETMLKDLIAQEAKLKDELFGAKPFDITQSAYYQCILNSPYENLNISYIAKCYGLDGSRLNNLLYEYGIQHKEGNVWVINDEYKDKGYVEMIDRGDYVYMVWTKEGQVFLYQLLREHGILPRIEQ